MELNQHFTEEDHKTLVNYMNMVDKHAVFGDLSQKDMISYFKALAFIQQVFLKKVETHILEVKRVVKIEEPVVITQPEIKTIKLSKRKS